MIHERADRLWQSHRDVLQYQADTVVDIGMEKRVVLETEEHLLQAAQMTTRSGDETLNEADYKRDDDPALEDSLIQVILAKRQQQGQ